MHGALGPLLGRQQRQSVGGRWREGLRGWVGGWGWEDSTLILAQVGWRWLRSALPFKEGKLMFFFRKHNIVREEHNGSLSPVFPCTSVWVRACTVCVCAWAYVCLCKCVAMMAPLSPPSSAHKRVGASSWLSFKVGLEFSKRHSPSQFYLLIQAKDISFNLSPCFSILPSITKTLGIFFWQWQGFLEREKKTGVKKSSNTLLNEWMTREPCNPV